MLLHHKFLSLLIFYFATTCAQADYTLDAVWQKISTAYPYATPFLVALPQINKSTLYYRPNLAMDIYQIDNSNLKPAVLLIHGGGWQMGSRDLWQPIALALAERGYVAITVSYRLTAQAGYPAAVEDIKAALDTVHQQAKKFHVDAQFIAIVGGSAGGQLAALVGLQWPVQAIVNVDGLSDFTTPLALQFENDPQREVTSASAWLGGRFEQVPARWREASPINHVGPLSPPMLFITSGEIRFSAGIELMQAKLTAQGVVNRRYEFSDAPHSFWLFEPWASKTVALIDQFFRQQKLEPFSELDSSYEY